MTQPTKYYPNIINVEFVCVFVTSPRCNDFDDIVCESGL